MNDVNESLFHRSLPSSNLEVRESIYAGKIYQLPANEASMNLIRNVRELVVDEIGEPIREVHLRFDDAGFFERVGRLRKAIYTSEEFRELVEQLIGSLGFPVEEQGYDPARMRVVAHNGHLNPAAAAVFHGHRDTWYGASQAMINWWIPIHDVVAEDSFEFFPDDFSNPVENDSEIFDFDKWVSEGQEKRVGWQNRKTGLTAIYPSLQQDPGGSRMPVVATAGEVLLFSSQHLHQTRENVTDKSRFSIDFRTVNLIDHEVGKYPKNVDNRSKGSSLVQFVKPGIENENS